MQDNLTQAANDAQNLTTQLQSHISNLQDTGMTSAILELHPSQMAEQASLESEAIIPYTSLMDYSR